MDEEDSAKVVKSIRPIDYIIIGIFMVSCYIGVIGQYTIMGQYIYHRISVNYKFVPDANFSRCLNISTNNSLIHNEIQSSAAQYNIYAQISSGIPSIIVISFSGALSDIYGRKLVILISWIGCFIGTLFNIFLISFNGPIWIYLLGQFLTGLGGNYGAMLVGVFSVVSDSTAHKNRNLGIIIIETSLGVSLIVSQALLGRWLKLNNFFWPILTFGLLYSFSGIIMVFIKETRLKCKIQNQTIKFYMNVYFNKILRLFHISGKINILLIFCLIALFIHVLNFFGNYTLLTIYLFGQPFCWNSEILGYFRSVSSGVIQLGIFLSILLLKLKLDEILIIQLGFVTNIFSRLMFAIAPAFQKSICDYLIYIASLDLLSGASVSLLRSVSSKLVSSDEYGYEYEYGTLFGMMSSMETLCGVLGGLIYNAIYDATLNVYYGFCYCVAVFLLTIALIIMISVAFLTRKMDSQGSRTWEHSMNHAKKENPTCPICFKPMQCECELTSFLKRQHYIETEE